MSTKNLISRALMLSFSGVCCSAVAWACTDEAVQPEVAPTPSPDGSADAAGPPTSTLDATPTPTPDAGPKLVTYTGTVHAFDPAQDLANQPVLKDAEVCAVSLPGAPCVKTNALGRWVMRLPANDRGLRLTHAAPGYLPVQYVSLTTEEDDTNDRTILAPDAIAQTFWSKCGAMYPDANGAIILQGFRRTGPNTYETLDGATMTASVGVGPCYMAKPFEFDPQPSTTKAAGAGAAVFANIPAGSSSVDVTISLTGAVCHSNGHVADGPSADVVRVPVRAGVLTALEVVCE